MTFISKQSEKPKTRKFDLTRHSDEDLHTLMDAVTSEMARRASVNAKRRALVRRLETLAESEGVTLDEVRLYMKGDTRVSASPESTGVEEPADNAAQPELDLPVFSGAKREVSLDRQFESLLQRELG